ncbi:MAG: FAD-dependent oxidoreductase [Rhodobacteraceae bacterium]|nr:FAD-dependent oxidoreductase [Paracoccaceae bacterium]
MCKKWHEGKRKKRLDALEKAGVRVLEIVIIGNSAAGLSAAEALRQSDQSSRLHIISKEGRRPYARVQLPYFLKNRVGRENMYFRNPDESGASQTSIIEGCVSAIDASGKSLTLTDGLKIPFDRLLIASGSTPVLPPIPGANSAGVHHIWTMEDALALKPTFEPGKRMLIIGGGFIAMQAAWAAVQCKMVVTLAVRSTIMRRDLDDHARAALTNRMAESGVDLIKGEVPASIKETGDGSLRVEFAKHHAAQVDKVIVATGVKPNTDFLAGSGIETDGGILVDEQMQTNIPGIFAAGDVAAARTSAGQDHVVRALWPCAVEQGKVAGVNLVGKATSYRGSLNMNVTELFGLIVASVGQFSDIGGRQVWTYGDPDQGSYFNVVLEDGIPVGGLSFGGPEGAGILGMLRPYIRQHKFLGRQRPDDLKRALQLRLFPSVLRARPGAAVGATADLTGLTGYVLP